MDRFEREALDRHITGNYGEDQFKGSRMLTGYDELEAAKAVRALILKLRDHADEHELTEDEREDLLTLVIQTLQKSHL